MADMLTINPRKPVSSDAPVKPERSRGNRGVAPVPVQSLGPILRERREAMGVTLAEAEVATRIRQKYLAALESDEWDLLPGEVVGRGFLRNYATYLGLEATEMIERRRAVADDSLAAVLVNTSAGSVLPPERKVDYRPKDVALKDEGNDLESPRRLNMAPFFVLVAIAALAFLTWWGVTQLGSQMGDWVAITQRQIAAWQRPAIPVTAAEPAPLSGNPVAPIVERSQEVAVPTAPALTDQAVLPPAEGSNVPATAAAGDNAAASAAVTAEAIAPTAEPTALSLLAILSTPTPQPVLPTPVPALAALAATTTAAANLRGGPSTDYPVVAGLPVGQALTISGRNADSTWYQLADGSWIFALLVANPPADVPIVEAPPLPPAAVQPAAEQTPVQ